MSQTANPLEALTLKQLRQRNSLKWQKFGPEVLPLWVAEMDVPMAAPVAAALQRVIAQGDTGYPHPEPYVEALCGFAAQRWGWDLRTEQVQAVADTMKGVVEALKLVTGQGDVVVVSSPVYPPFFMYPASAGRHVVQAPLGKDGRLSFSALERAFQEAAVTGSRAAYLLCNPHNPTGVVHSRLELEQLAQLARSYGVSVVADEIHAPLVCGQATFTPYLTVDPYGLSLMSASKAWNLPGLKAALLVAGEGAVPHLQRLPPEVAHGPSHVGVLAQTAAYAGGGSWLDGLRAGLESNRLLLSELLSEHLPQVQWHQPEATYLAWLDFTAYGFHDDAPSPGAESPMQGPAKLLLENAKVALTAGHPFGEGGQRHARLNFATHPAILEEAVTRMGRALN